MPEWALPEDNGPMLVFSDDVSAIKMAMALEKVFLFSQIVAIALQIVNVLRSMVREIIPTHPHTYSLCTYHLSITVTHH